MRSLLDAFDHLVWSEPDLDEGIQRLAARTGVEPVPGGSHPGRGTRNALMSLGDRHYFELIAPDPAQTGSWAQGLPPTPGIIHWAIAVDDLERKAAALPPELTGGNAVSTFSRQSPAGLLSWQLLFLGGHAFGGLVPFLIDWGTSPHPAKKTPPGCRLQSIALTCPDVATLSDVFGHLELEANLIAGPPALSFTLATPNGEQAFRSEDILSTGLHA